MFLASLAPTPPGAMAGGGGGLGGAAVAEAALEASKLTSRGKVEA